MGGVSVLCMLAVDLRLPNPKPFRRESIKLIGGDRFEIEEVGEGKKWLVESGCGRIIDQNRFPGGRGGGARRRKS